MKKIKNIIKKFFKKEKEKTSEKTKETEGACGKVPTEIPPTLIKPKVFNDEVILNDFLRKLNVIINSNSKRK